MLQKSFKLFSMILLTVSLTCSSFQPASVSAKTRKELEEEEERERREREEREEEERETEQREREEAEERERALEEEHRREKEEEEERDREKREEERRKEERDRKDCDKDHKHHNDKHDKNKNNYVYTNGLSLNTNALTIIQGLNVRVYPTVSPSNANNKTVLFSSNNPLVANVDIYGNIYALNPGMCMITAQTVENGFKAYVAVNVVSAVTNQATNINTQQSITYDSSFLSNVTAQVLMAVPYGTVLIPAAVPMSYDVNVANALKMRPDVTLSATFPNNGHMVCMTLPAGFNLSSHLKNGYADWTKLMKKSGVTVVNLS